MTDEEIQMAVLEQYRWDARVAPNEIGIVVKDGVVSLTGTVDSFWKKWDAEEIALRVKGVKAVANELEVRLPDSAVRGDEDIARAVKDALELAHDVPDTVKASVNNGWVTLAGEVEWYHQKEAAERRVRGAIGVKGVINNVAVKPRAKAENLKHRIEQALVRLAETDAKRIEVEVLEGSVKLKGSVHSWHEKQEALRAAWLAPGVQEVVDELQIMS